MSLIDTHCHLYLPEFDAELVSLTDHARAKGVEGIFLPAIDSETHRRVIGLEEAYPDLCHAMMGLHPCSVKDDYRNELDLVADYIKKRKFSAIGECGLDFYWDKTYVKEQYIALEAQLQWALDLNWPVVLHTRNATRETIDAVLPFAGKGLRGIFHCFGGSLEEARDIISMGFYLGIGGVLTYKNSGLQEVIREIPLEHIVLETDAPYLSPVPHRGKRNQPVYILHVAEKLAEVKEVSFEEISAITTMNAKSLFGI